MKQKEKLKEVPKILKDVPKVLPPVSQFFLFDSNLTLFLANVAFFDQYPENTLKFHSYEIISKPK